LRNLRTFSVNLVNKAPPILLAVLMSLVLSPSHAPVHASENDDSNGYFEITGLVIEETMTPAGHNLYESFNARWKPMEGLSYTITVKERQFLPVPGG